MAEETEGGMPNDGEVKTNEGVSVETLRAELEKARAALKAVNQESATRRKRLEELEAAEKKRAEAEQTEVERLKAQAAEAQLKASRAEAEMASLRLRAAVERAAAKLSFATPEDAFQLADLASVTADESGNFSGVDEALKALAKDKPYLLRQTEGGSPKINANEQSKGKGAPPIDAIIAAKRGRSGYSI